MKISNGMKWVAACIAFASSTVVFAGPKYETVVYGNRVLYNNMVCTQVITSQYSDASMQKQYLISSVVTYTACEANAYTGGGIGDIGSVGATGTTGPGGPQGRIVNPERDGLGGSQGRIVDPNRTIVDPEIRGATGKPGQQ